MNNLPPELMEIQMEIKGTKNTKGTLIAATTVKTPVRLVHYSVEPDYE
jgi:hypothetical protein